MQQFPTLGRLYLDNHSTIDSYLPEFVRQSDVFNKEVKNILIKISELETSNSLPHQQQQHVPNFSSIHQQVAFLRKLVNQKNLELENDRKQIEELRGLRMNDCSIIQQLEGRVRVLQQQREDAAGRHRAQKEHLQERINKIQQQIDVIEEKKEERRCYELETQVEMLRSKLKQQGKDLIAENLVDSYKIDQLTQEIMDLRELNNNLARVNGDLKFQLQLMRSQATQTEEYKSKIISQEVQISQLRSACNERVELSHKLSIKQNQLNYQNDTIESLNRQIQSLKHTLNEVTDLNHKLGIASQSERQVEFLNLQIQDLRRQIQQLQKKQTETYEEKLKYEREVYKLTNDLHDSIPLKGEIESKRFQLQMSRNQIIRLKSDIDLLARQNKQVLNAKQYFQQALRRSDQQKQDMSMRLQMFERELGKMKQLESQLGVVSQQLNEAHQKFIQASNRQSQMSFKYEILMKEHEGLKGAFSNAKYESESHRHAIQNKLYEREQQSRRLNDECNQLRVLNQRLECRRRQLEHQLQYNESKFCTFQENLLEFQRSYKQSEIELQQIKSSITELQQLQNIFLSKQARLMELVALNVNRLIKYREGIRVEHNYKLQKRINVLNQIVEIIEAQNFELTESKAYLKNLQEAVQKYSSEVDKGKLQINTLTFQKQHLLNQIDSMLEKLRYVESNLQRQARVVQVQNQEIDQLKRMHKNASERLGEEMQKKVWLQNKLSGAGIIDVESIRLDRNDTMRRMKGLLEE